MRAMRTFLIAVAVFAASLDLAPLGARQGTNAAAIRGARIVTGAGAPIERGTVVMRAGLIEAVGADVTPPADAIVVDGTGLTVYPGLIDMANASVIETPAAPAGAATGGRGGAPPAAGTTATTETYADAERVKRERILTPDFEAARHVRADGAELQRLAAAGITSVLAIPPSGLLRGQSALVNVGAPPEGPSISAVAFDRRTLVVVRAGVAEHVAFEFGRGVPQAGYPGTLLGIMAFIRQSFFDAQWQRDARAFSDRHPEAPRPAFEPALDALVPALAGKQPVAFAANQAREISRALDIAKEFSLDPIIVGGAEAAKVASDLKAAKARVIYSLNFQAAGGRGGGGRGGAADTPARVQRAIQDAPKVPSMLEQAGVPIAFSSEGLSTPIEFVRNAGRTVRDGGLSPEAALRALTSGAAKIAGAGDRLGTIEKGRIGNVVVTDGDLFADATHVKYVFIDGRLVDIDVPPAPASGRGGRGGPRR